MATPELTAEQTAAGKSQVEAFLFDRHFERVDDRDITGYGDDREFHIYCGRLGASVTMIHRFQPEMIDEVFLPYNDQTVVSLYNLIGR